MAPRVLGTELRFEGATMDYESNDTVGGYAVPVDPMDLLQCDSCQ
ncbi:hypothetical protein [Gryllotalpicola kribbensis]